jgi:hypothetical protein
LNVELENVISECRSYAEEHEGEITSELSDKLNNIQMERDEKIENVVMYYKNEDAMSASIQLEISALQKRANIHENNALWAKNWLSMLVERGRKIEFSKGRISWRNTKHVEITDLSKIPDSLMRIIPETKEPNKIALKEELQAGKIIEGAILVEEPKIQIK